MKAPLVPRIPTRSRIAPCSLRQGQAASGGGPGGPALPFAARGVLEKAGRDEEVVPPIEQRGCQKEEQNEQFRPVSTLTRATPYLRFARALDDLITGQVGPGSAE
jgi:hypothetical protein